MIAVGDDRISAADCESIGRHRDTHWALHARDGSVESAFDRASHNDVTTLVRRKNDAGA